MPSKKEALTLKIHGLETLTIFLLNNFDFFGIFRFFKMPLQMAIGLYLAFMMLIGTAAGIAYFAEGIDYCNEFKFAVSADKLLPIFWEL